jgi:heme-degrading monooxygenase HmoA
MFIAMNHFRVQPGRGEAFEQVWRERESFLQDVPGFVQFALLRGDDDAYISHSIWESREAFEAWTESESFTRGHRGGGSMADILAGHPEVKLWESVIVEERAVTAAGD